MNTTKYRDTLTCQPYCVPKENAMHDLHSYYKSFYMYFHFILLLNILSLL